ncbi:MAG: hypothetical protein ACRD3W_10455 [Terriglobales bacterium]
MDGARRLDAWLAALNLVASGKPYSVNKFAKKLKVAYDTAWHIFNKIATAIESKMDHFSESVSSALFSLVFVKRSRETPAREHPIREQDEAEAKAKAEAEVEAKAKEEEEEEDQQQQPQSEHGEEGEQGKQEIQKRVINSVSENNADGIEATEASALSKHEQAVYDLLSDEPIQFNDLCRLTQMNSSEVSACLTTLEIANLVTQSAGDRYVRAQSLQPKRPAPELLDASVSEAAILLTYSFLQDIREHFHGISRKYLQKHLALFWSRCEPFRWTKGRLLKTCLDRGIVSHADILNYVSERLVKIGIPTSHV